MIELVNGRTDQTLASAVEMADTRATRRRGLLGRDGIDVASALAIVPCWAIHTAFMRFPIDVVFVSRDGVVVRIASHVGAWRIVAAPGAYAAIELAAGAAESRGVRLGDRLYTRAGDGSGPVSSIFASVNPRRLATS
jgi:uncharacterized membrane protein (UPF0127 family)